MHLANRIDDALVSMKPNTRFDARRVPISIRRQLNAYADELTTVPIELLPDVILQETQNFKAALGRRDHIAQVGHALAVSTVWKELAGRFTQAATLDIDDTETINDIPLPTELT